MIQRKLTFLRNGFVANCVGAIRDDEVTIDSVIPSPDLGEIVAIDGVGLRGVVEWSADYSRNEIVLTFDVSTEGVEMSRPNCQKCGRPCATVGSRPDGDSQVRYLGCRSCGYRAGVEVVPRSSSSNSQRDQAGRFTHSR